MMRRETGSDMKEMVKHVRCVLIPVINTSRSANITAGNRVIARRV
jgi:hypothetical protein